MTSPGEQPAAALSAAALVDGRQPVSAPVRPGHNGRRGRDDYAPAAAGGTRAKWQVPNRGATTEATAPGGSPGRALRLVKLKQRRCGQRLKLACVSLELRSQLRAFDTDARLSANGFFRSLRSGTTPTSYAQCWRLICHHAARVNVQMVGAAGHIRAPKWTRLSSWSGRPPGASGYFTERGSTAAVTDQLPPGHNILHSRRGSRDCQPVLGGVADGRAPWRARLLRCAMPPVDDV